MYSIEEWCKLSVLKQMFTSSKHLSEQMKYDKYTWWILFSLIVPVIITYVIEL